MKVKVWGARGSVPAPGPEMNRYGGNTSCVQVDPLRRHELILDAGTGIRALGVELGRRPAGQHPAHPPAPGPHPGPDVLRALLPRRSRGSRSGARPRPRPTWRSGSPATSRRRSRRSRSASCPATSPSSTRRATEWEIGAGDDPRRGGHPPRADPRLPDHRRRRRPSATSPTTSRRSARRSRGSSPSGSPATTSPATPTC